MFKIIHCLPFYFDHHRRKEENEWLSCLGGGQETPSYGGYSNGINRRGHVYHHRPCSNAWTRGQQGKQEQPSPQPPGRPLLFSWPLQLLETGVVSLRESVLRYPGLRLTSCSWYGGQDKLVERWFPLINITLQRNILIIPHSWRHSHLPNLLIVEYLNPHKC